MEIFLFDERQGNGFAASATKDGGDLPGGAPTWKPHGSFQSDDAALPPDVTGIGDVSEIVSAVQSTGTFITTKPKSEPHEVG